MDGPRIVPLAPYPTTGEEAKAPRRRSVFQNIRSGSVAPRISDAKPRRSSLLHPVKETAVVVPFSLDSSGDIRPPLFTRNSKTFQSVEEDEDNPPDGPSPKRQAFVGPIPLPVRQPSHLVESFTMFGFSLAPLYDLWERLQVSHCGQYLVERMLALDEYCQRTSYRRVLAVCVLTPLIPLVVVILMELVPLSPSEAGASGNYVFWSRHALTIAITVMCAEMQATSWIPELPLTTKQALLIAVGAGILTNGLELLVAEFLVFPIPFLSILGAPVLLVFWVIMSRAVLGLNPIFGVQDAEFRGRRFLQIVSLQMLLLLIYPAYQAVFLTVDGFWQMLTISLLPVINVGLKNTLVACGSHLEDNLPELVVLTVDGFSALYSVICMRGTNSLKMVAVTVVLNAFVLVLFLHGMNRRSRAARESRSFHLMQIRRREALRTPSFLLSYSRQERLSTLVVTTLKLLRAPGQLDPTVLREIRLLSGMQHKLSAANCALLQSLAARSVYSNDRRISHANSISQMKSRYASAAIEGRVFSASHFSVPTPPTSQIAQRIRAAIRALPEAGLRIGSGGGSFPRSNSKGADAEAGPDSLRQIEKLVKASSRWILERTTSPKPPLHWDPR
ncbi:hypothetical protein V7S43_017329 [Phytophthora oleae]|uniref:Transmembrane protein n=1 Tax=Phytophthora oleae TaxID=2107226 RepID=A0ABD3EVP2_9STRA